MKKFKTEMWGSALAVLSAKRFNNDGEPQLLGIASVNKQALSDGRFFIETKTEIRPYCHPLEIKDVQEMLFDYIKGAS